MGRVTTYVVGIVAVSVFLGAIAVLDVEREAASANIASFGDAIWWASATVTTVGYGDFYPVTLAGRLVAIGLMVVGIGTVGAVTASVAAWMVKQVDSGTRS